MKERLLDFKDLKRNLKRDNSMLPVVKVALVGDTATQLLATALQGMAVECGCTLELMEAEYNQVERQFLDPQSELRQADAEYVILFRSSHKLAQRHAQLTPEQRLQLASDEVQFVADVCSDPYFASRRIIVMNYAEVDDGIYGNYASKEPSSLLYQLRKLNYELMQLACNTTNLFIADLAAVQSRLGSERVFPASVYISTEMVLSIDALPAVAARVIDIIMATRGQFKKCLILDLDNTLWGGIVGDDGVEGLQLGHGLGIGKAFTEFQLWIKKLKQRGIILCVASKNDEDKARAPFRSHPDMVLHEDDIAVFMANWETKVDNIRAIQEVLNIGFDSMVFVDDNPFERAMVREAIPAITVPEMPDDPALYVDCLSSLNLFETATHSQGDEQRTRQYQVEAQRVSLKRTFDSEEAFLKSLEMTSHVEGITPFNTPRVAQLSQRSNQFNLRTVRYIDADIEAMATNPAVTALTFTLADRLGDNGLVSVVIMRRQGDDTMFIDTWIMSCRVLKRGMEHFVLNCLVEAAQQAGCRRIVGEYLPTAKNGMVKDHYLNLGFEPLNATGDTPAQYVLELDSYTPHEVSITRK